MEEGMSGFYVKANGSVVRAANGSHHGSSGTKCGRWNPTTEQVKVLTDLFRSGLRTPSTDQIQKISTQLSFYGKIESKNVFYWFQNHKARERQKRRKVSMDENDFTFRRDDKLQSSKRFVEFNNHQGIHHDHQEPERVLETLQLFPLNSFEETEQEKVRLHANHEQYCREAAAFPYTTMGSEMDHPPLDLRLSFM